MDYRALFLAPLAALVLGVGAATPLRMPAGWLPHNTFIFSELTQTASQGYDMGIDAASDAAGTPALTVRRLKPSSPLAVDMGAMRQSVDGYAGKRLRFSGQLRADAVKAWAGLYLGPGDGTLLNRMAVADPGGESLVPAGTTVAADGRWHDASVVIDVPADAPSVDFGVALVGEGQVWARNLKFEVVGPEVATTRMKMGVDLGAVRRAQAESNAALAKLPPEPLVNAALD